MNRVLAGVICGLLVAVAGCKPGGWVFFQKPLSLMTPHEFASDPVQRTLAEAVDREDAAAIAKAVEAGADLNAFGADGYRLLYWAMARGKAAGFEQLLQHGAKIDIDYRDPESLRDQSYRHTVLEQVIANPSPRFLEAALRQGLDPDCAPHAVEKRSLLFFAGSSHSHSAIETLLAAGADIDWQDHSGHTPLVESGMACNYNTAWFLLERGADPTVKDKWGHDFVWGLKEYGSRGVRPDHRESFEKIVAELISRGVLTRQDIVEADKPKQSVLDGPPGITVIEHSPDSEAGQAILQLDQAERDANARDRAERGR